MTPSAERRAFEAFLRHGRVPAQQAAPATRWGLSQKALGEIHPTTHYTWRTARDEKVRSAHAANDGHVFSWSDPPATGHPGQAHNCRCWAEPYYGTPMVPDARLVLTRTFEADSTGRELWASLETLTRPDGSLARSTVSLRDGAQIHSSFAGSSATHNVRLPDGQTVRVERRDGVQSIFAGRGDVPLTRSVWTADGPKVAVPRQRIAQGPAAPSFGPVNEFDEIELLDPSRLSVPPPDALLAIGGAGLAMLDLFNILTAKPASLGAGGGDVAVVAFRAWRNDRTSAGALVALAALTAEQVAQSCERLPDVQRWTNDAAAGLMPLRATMTPQPWGTAIHKKVEEQVELFRSRLPLGKQDIWAELSIDPTDPKASTRRGQPGSTRLDVLEKVNSMLVCVYDAKNRKCSTYARQS